MVLTFEPTTSRIATLATQTLRKGSRSLRTTFQSRPSIPMLIALCMTGLLILSACASPPAPAAEPAISNTTAEVAGKVSFMVFGDPAELKAYQDLVATFEAKFPAIDMELIHIPSQSDYRKRLSADFAAGIPSDVVLLNYRRFGPFAAKGALEPIGPYLQASEVISQTDFYPEPMAPYNWQGQQWCLPQNFSSLVVYDNKEPVRRCGAGLSGPGLDMVGLSGDRPGINEGYRRRWHDRSIWLGYRNDFLAPGAFRLAKRR